MHTFVEKMKGIWAKISPVYHKIVDVIETICRVIFRLRKVFMAIPVVWAAFKLAAQNADRLPEMVGLNLQSTGEFAVMVNQNYAVYGPLGVTLFCLFLMFCSRKTLFPWIVSIFTLALPYLIWLTNMYPA